MISISTATASINGNVIINNTSSSRLKEKTARVTRTATLDGGVYINHSGYTDGDRTLHIKEKISKNIETKLNNIFELYNSVIISLDDGCYDGVIDRMTSENGNLNMTIMIKQKD